MISSNKINTRKTDNQSLISAASNGDLDKLKQLLSRDDIDINYRDKKDNTDINTWINREPLCIKELLLHDDTALIRAIKNNHDECAKELLLRDDININASGNMGDTPLRAAVHKYGQGPKLLKKLLLKLNIDVNARDFLGNTVLMMAITVGNIDCVKVLLLRRDIDINCTNIYGQRALDMAISMAQVECLKALLLRHDLHINYEDRDGHTPLMRAVRYGYPECIIPLLFLNDLNVSAKNQRGETALTLSKDCFKPHAEEYINNALIARPLLPLFVAVANKDKYCDVAIRELPKELMLLVAEMLKGSRKIGPSL